MALDGGDDRAGHARRHRARAASPARARRCRSRARTGVAAFSVYEDGKYDIYTIDDAARRPTRTAARRASMTAADAAAGRSPSRAHVARAAGRRALRPAAASSTTHDADYQADALARRRRAADDCRRREPLWRRGRRRHRRSYFSDMLGDHTLADRGAAQLRASRSGFSLKNTAAQVGVHQPGAPVELGRRRRTDSVPERRIPERRRRDAAGRAGRGRSDDHLPADGAERRGHRRLSVQPRAADRVPGRRDAGSRSIRSCRRRRFRSTPGSCSIDDDRRRIARRAADARRPRRRRSSYDTSNFGATSPVQGQRYRLEASPTFGSINFTSLLADYRRYFMPVSFYTIAARVMHYGRYGSGGEDPRLFPLFIGYPNLVRGYDVELVRRGRLRADGGEPVPRVRSAARQPHARRQHRVPLSAAAAVRRRRSGCTGRCRWRSRCSPTAAWPGTAASRRRSSAAIAAGRRQRRRHAAGEPVRLRRRPVRLRASVPAARTGLGVPVQSVARVLTGLELVSGDWGLR